MKLRLWVPPARRLLEGVDVSIGDRDQTKHIVVRKELLSLFNTDAMSCHFETMKSIMQTHIRDWADKGSAPFPILSSLKEMTFAIVYGWYYLLPLTLTLTLLARSHLPSV